MDNQEWPRSKTKSRLAISLHELFMFGTVFLAVSSWECPERDAEQLIRRTIWRTQSRRDKEVSQLVPMMVVADKSIPFSL